MIDERGFDPDPDSPTQSFWFGWKIVRMSKERGAVERLLLNMFALVVPMIWKLPGEVSIISSQMKQARE
jgi:hypothetical protein